MAVAPPTLKRTDPRPVVVDGADGPLLVGIRCTRCGHPSATSPPRCARCGGETAEARFGPDGTVWATTTIHVASGVREAPYTLAYVDLDDGPRLLAHVQDGPGLGLRVAERARLTGETAGGDPHVKVIR